MSQPLLSFLLILCGVLAGVCGAALTHWGLIKFLRELEYRLTDLEERLIRELKVRAAHASNAKRKEEDQLEEWAKEQSTGTTPSPSLPATLREWQLEKMRGPR